ncbi:MAG: carboxymuconolactone decarboxylase family protein [Rickettsiales bacterium]|nr:carboxymuconolactone decarboxylase family protein [Pseudomonadota bacterium]MDA0966474.1 carboxymuconolactone decarboxylase family protein [Pseudomonadota bacterium]MDG4543336.1 carboxymuconolactone decarboxylase family protein [Rickettsiales bacterium]MDG4545602.1 carboxymuconolactone decarboxylase family protein [Rickettsiales bacterium]MDG4548051.1 carboxymuconolactone decarboxylase family protein [Rickettsiales bacterium]
MSIKDIRSSLGEYAKDIKLNLGNVLTEEGSPDLNLSQINGIALASVYATSNEELIKAVESDAKEHLSEDEVNAAKASATVMAMNNIYYRFVHLASDKDYGKMPANLRMNIIGNPGIAKVDFELYSLAVSAINGCGMCIDAHVRQVEKEGVSKTGIQSSIRIASVINATAQALTIG